MNLIHDDIIRIALLFCSWGVFSPLSCRDTINIEINPHFTDNLGKNQWPSFLKKFCTGTCQDEVDITNSTPAFSDWKRETTTDSPLIILNHTVMSSLYRTVEKFAFFLSLSCIVGTLRVFATKGTVSKVLDAMAIVENIIERLQIV